MKRNFEKLGLENDNKMKTQRLVTWLSDNISYNKQKIWIRKALNTIVIVRYIGISQRFQILFFQKLLLMHITNCKEVFIAWQLRVLLFLFIAKQWLSTGILKIAQDCRLI